MHSLTWPTKPVDACYLFVLGLHGLCYANLSWSWSGYIYLTLTGVAREPPALFYGHEAILWPGKRSVLPTVKRSRLRMAKCMLLCPPWKMYSL